MHKDTRFGLDKKTQLLGPVQLDSGAQFAPVEFAYETYGALNADKSNAILICHALTGDQYVASNHPVTGKAGWWTRMVGPGKPIDPARHCIISINVMGSCMGSSGPASIDPVTGAPYAMGFPVITSKNGQLWRACDDELRDELGLDEQSEITDEMRCSFVRDLLAEDWNLHDFIVGISQRWLEDDNGNSCLIGYTEELEGQGGVVRYWHGAFADEGVWQAYLNDNGYTLASEPANLGDEILLSLYQKDE